eukprot:8561923-Karenia_brevis.AAC.1
MAKPSEAFQDHTGYQYKDNLSHEGEYKDKDNTHQGLSQVRHYELGIGAGRDKLSNKGRGVTAFSLGQ